MNGVYTSYSSSGWLDNVRFDGERWREYFASGWLDKLSQAVDLLIIWRHDHHLCIRILIIRLVDGKLILVVNVCGNHTTSNGKHILFIMRLWKAKHFFHSSIFSFSQNLLDNQIIFDGCSAVGAYIESRSISLMSLKVFEALLMELMEFMAGKLNDPIAIFHKTVTKATFSHIFSFQGCIDGATESLTNLLNH